MKSVLLSTVLVCGAAYGQAPVTLTTKPVRRTTAQIMQGQVPEPLLSSGAPAVGTGSPVVVKHFTVADYQETGQYGPSAESSVGSEQLLVASKGRVRSFSKNGVIDNVLNLTFDSFYSPISRGGFTADPNVLFHPLWKRWIIFGNAFLYSSLVLAISDSDPITPATVWSFYIVDQISHPGFSPTAFFDYTTLGADAQAVYCAANLIDEGTFVSSAAYAIPLSSLENSTEALVYAWRNLDSAQQPLRPFTFQPALNFDQEPKAGYFPSIDWNDALTNGASRVLVNLVTFTDSVPTLSDPIAVPVLPFVQPLTVNALGTPPSHPISPVVGFRLSPSHVRNNRLWLIYNISVDNNGVSNLPACPPPQGTLTRDAARFTQIDVTKLSTPSLAVVTQGTLFARTPSNVLGARSFLTPSIMSNANGAVLIGATTCGEQERLNAAVAQLVNNNTEVGTPVLYTESTSDYNATEDWEFNPYARWGDHTRVSPDPEDPRAFWTSQQWCSQENTWALEAAQVLTQ